MTVELEKYTLEKNTLTLVEYHWLIPVEYQVKINGHKIASYPTEEEALNFYDNFIKNYQAIGQ